MDVVNRKPLATLENPTCDEAASFIAEALSKHMGLIVIGNCCVEYKGRANSELEPGERIVILKEDGSVLVHRPTGYEPVNWQPPGSILHIHTTCGVLQVRAVRRKPPETIKLHFECIYLLSAFSLVDNGEFSLHASEEDMQKAILFEPEIVEQGLKLITYEKKVEPGFVDLYGIDNDGKLVVIEIKRKTAGHPAILQLAKYVDSIKASANREVRGILVAPSIAKGVQRLLATLKLDYKLLDPKKCAKILKKPETKRLEEFFKENE